jgi:NAD(P)-dependent dehydrogenase (short-subunit alcohol dehydrogenase family)
MIEQEHAGKVAIVTGGGRGFGKAFGHALAARGAHVVQVDIDSGVSEDAAAEIRAAGGSASAVAADVADETAVAALIAQVVDRHGGIDILINNAGLHSAEFNAPCAELGLPRLKRLFDVNVIGVLTCTMLAQEHMAGRPGAAIVNISSTAAYGSGTAYGVSKLAVQGLTMMSARELGPTGIRVNAIAPGLILTDTIRAELPQTVVDMVKGQQVMDLEGEERDIVEMMLFLVSDRARFITGETFRVAAGFTLAI